MTGKIKLDPNRDILFVITYYKVQDSLGKLSLSMLKRWTKSDYTHRWPYGLAHSLSRNISFYKAHYQE